MAPLLHDRAVADSVRARIRSLSPDSTRRWGKMSVDQMLWHCNQSLTNSLGDWHPTPVKTPLPRPLMKMLVFTLPWPKGAPTAPEFVAGTRYDFAAERDRALALIDRFVAKSMGDGDWPPSAAFGPMTGQEWSRLQAKHFDHHLRQFSA